MTDREKVIQDLLEACAYFKSSFDAMNGTLAGETMYRWAQSIADAVALLKAQEPRLMTLEDAQSCEKAMWIELLGGKGFYAFVLDRMKNGILEISTRAAYLRYYSKDYNVKWRCWTSRPTDTQREAVKWE